MAIFAPIHETPLATETDADLNTLERRLDEERARRIAEQEEIKRRFERDGCKWKAGFLINYCATCGCDEGEMKACNLGAAT